MQKGNAARACYHEQAYTFGVVWRKHLSRSIPKVYLDTEYIILQYSTFLLRILNHAFSGDWFEDEINQTCFQIVNNPASFCVSEERSDSTLNNEPNEFSSQNLETISFNRIKLVLLQTVPFQAEECLFLVQFLLFSNHLLPLRAKFELR